MLYTNIALLATVLVPGTTMAFILPSIAQRMPVLSSTESTEDAPPTDVATPQTPPTPPLRERMMKAEDIEGGRRTGQNSFSDVDTQIFARNPVLDTVAIAGDNSFDPFSLATDKATLLSYRGAEIRHGRLAMLAAIGWPVSELVQPQVAKLLGLASNGLARQTQAPSVLNGGLGDVTPLFWIAVAAGAAALELHSLDCEKKGNLPGDLGFDPLNMGKNKMMASAEIQNGRVAMLAITGFAVQEALYRVPVVAETPFFFHPIF
mmetsp:Transcript_54256/g.109119  ORF Transcript_54256/g.109119 Transcript_54256/m.109119 type:complete len:262 (-) Transcript_54256:250-1035(-)